ncbi:hypothetical protein [Virgibacillus salexigens]|uniref:Uncharacterized protein n=1 Tax=Virgibacillus massiliensis TaxID=1462526 RepID=A0A024QH38_9BACI|nr:hypothetical protein [Virgibacillus massiliensis]CDQ41878.1 hypothetical protein BN990_04257 [Virgibacillus massiliensis]
MFEIPKIQLPTPEEAVQIRKDKYKSASECLENMSYWLPKVEASSARDVSSLQIPFTKTITLNLETYEWLLSDNYTQETIQEFNQSIIEDLGDFLIDQKLFIKTGNFSNKFQFKNTVVSDREKLGKQFLNIYYDAMCFGVPDSNEIVIREYIEDKEDRPTIYSGMPLHTEFRVFYDFDIDEPIGISNYWHPDEMLEWLSEPDLTSYKSIKDTIVSDFNKYKKNVVLQVSILMQGVTSLKGKWSIDVMKNGEDFWIIDMARMERSALVNKMESLT